MDSIVRMYRVDNGTVQWWRDTAKAHGADSFKRRPVPRSMNYSIITIEWRKHSWAASNESFAPFKAAIGEKDALYRYVAYATRRE